jgi:inhibitor of cysteine peptidase
VKLKIFFLSAALIGLAEAGLAASPKIITEADANHLVTLQTGQEAVLKLPSNRSTGYSWLLTDSKDSVLTSLGKPTYQVSRSLPGAGGIETWKFQATKAGNGSLKFEYRRPWEKKVAPAKTVFFYVTVK